MLFRALFPSWRFFEELGRVPKLSFRIVGSSETEWSECLAPERMGLGALFLNARGNLRMAGNSLVEQLVTDLSELEDGATDEAVTSSVSYELVTRLVRSQVRELGGGGPGKRFQFRVVAAVPGATEREGEEILISSEHEA